MAEGHREQIMAALQDVLGSLTGVCHWGEELLPTPVCERRYRAPTTTVRFPHFIVEEGDGSLFSPPGALQQSEGFGLTTGVGYEDRIIADVYCWVKGEAGEEGIGTGTWINRMWWETLLRLKAHRELGGLCNEIHPVGPWQIIDLEQQPLVACVLQPYQVIVNPVSMAVEP